MCLALTPIPLHDGTEQCLRAHELQVGASVVQCLNTGLEPAMHLVFWASIFQTELLFLGWA